MESERDLYLSFNNQDELINYLTTELGYCSCVPDAPIYLRDTLRLMKRLNRGELDHVWQEKSAQLQQRWDENPLLFSWLLFFLAQKDLIWHGFNLSDCWLTTKGEYLLDSLNQFL